MKKRIPWNKGLRGAQVAWNKGLSTQLVNRDCLKCGKQFKEYTSDIEAGNGKYCSRKCWNEGHPVWNKGLLGFKAGERSHFWKGGITPLVRSLREYKPYKKLMADRKRLDNYTCVICRAKGVTLHTDHYPKAFSLIMKQESIKSMKEFISNEEMWDINNLRTLCIDCHKNTDTYGGKMRGGNYLEC